MSAFSDEMPGAWELFHATKMAFGLLHLSSPGGCRHGTSSENSDQVAMLTGQALPESFPWSSGCCLEVHCAYAFDVQPSAGGLGQSSGPGNDPQSVQRVRLVGPEIPASPKSSFDVLVGFFIASSETNASVRLVFNEFQA